MDDWFKKIMGVAAFLCLIVVPIGKKCTADKQKKDRQRTTELLKRYPDGFSFYRSVKVSSEESGVLHSATVIVNSDGMLKVRIDDMHYSDGKFVNDYEWYWVVRESGEYRFYTHNGMWRIKGL